MPDAIHMDDKARMSAKVLSLKGDDLRKQFTKYGVRGFSSAKAGLQDRLIAFLSDEAHTEQRTAFLVDVDLQSSYEFLKGYCRNEHIVAQACRPCYDPIHLILCE